MIERTQADYPQRLIHMDELTYCWEHPDYADNPMAPAFLARYSAAEAMLVTLPEEIGTILGSGRSRRLLDVFESIRDNGYWKHVPVIAHPYESGPYKTTLYAVVPGNERLCALRALLRFDPVAWDRIMPDRMVPARVSLPGDLVDDATPADLLFERPGRG